MMISFKCFADKRPVIPQAVNVADAGNACRGEYIVTFFDSDEEDAHAILKGAGCYAVSAT